MKKLSRSDKLFDMINIVLLTLMMLVILYPLYFILIASVSSPTAVNAGEVLLFPKGATLEGYKYVLKDTSIWKGYANTIILTITGTLVNMFLSVTCAYALSKSHLPFIKFIMFAMTFTMFFSGGIIPTYLLVSGLGMREYRIFSLESATGLMESGERSRRLWLEFLPGLVRNLPQPERRCQSHSSQ